MFCEERMPAEVAAENRLTTSVWLVGPAVRKVSSNMPKVRTSTRIPAASMPGSSSGAMIRPSTLRVGAPHIRAACSSRGSICSMNGVIV
jgi:hypothetical protein